MVNKSPVLLKVYILQDKQVVECSDLLTWAEFMSDNNFSCFDSNRYADVSTVFLGKNVDPTSPTPIVFETMVFGDQYHGYQRRYSTWDEAIAGHQEICEMVGVKPKSQTLLQISS